MKEEEDNDSIKEEIEGNANTIKVEKETKKIEFKDINSQNDDRDENDSIKEEIEG